jgi:hypothetical protein
MLGGSFSGTRSLPSSWGITRLAGNPVITVSPGNPSEAVEQYDPAPIRLPSGDIWCYVKGASTDYGWKSTDGETFTLQNGGSPVIAHGAGGAWDHDASMESAAVYDSASDTIHLWYKGSLSGVYGWGHATAPGSTPQTFTKDVGNPILTAATVATALGGGTVTDLGIVDVVKVGTNYTFFGYALDGTGKYRNFTATGSSWNNPSGVTGYHDSPSSTTIDIVTSVFALPGLGSPLYAALRQYGTSSVRSLKLATTPDFVTWTFPAGDFMAPVPATWESAWTYAAHLLKEDTPPYTAPVIDGSGRWRLYYSGTDLSVGGVGPDDSGLAYLVPVWS